jgi:hypothetical protein
MLCRGSARADTALLRGQRVQPAKHVPNMEQRFAVAGSRLPQGYDSNLGFGQSTGLQQFG